MTISVLRLVLPVALCSLLAPAILGQNGDEGLMNQRPEGWWEERYETMLESRIFANLVASPSLYGTDIGVAVEGHTATLTGTVSNEAEQQRALWIARRTSGVMDVQDRLTVDRKAVEGRRAMDVPDEELAQRVAKKLAQDTLPTATAEQEWLFGWEVEGPNFEFDVDADDGMITLDGTVNSWSEIGDAIRAARSVPGVKSVHSDLEVDEAQSYSLAPRDYYRWYPFVR